MLLYSVGGLRYIDALFFASGASTQSGLNTVNVNDLFLYQQIVLILIACVANPIWINSLVVFIRLYWFEKRFQNVVQDARSWRRTGTRSRTKSEARHDPDLSNEERGVGGREIRVLRAPNGNAHIRKFDDHKDDESDPQTDSNTQSLETEPNGEAKRQADDESSSPHRETEVASPTAFTRDIVWADEVKPPRAATMDNKERLPQQRTQEENIAFLENQRKGEKVKLRVPGPRDFDRGEVPHGIDEDDPNDIGRKLSREDSPELHREKGSRRNSQTLVNKEESQSDLQQHQRKGLKWVPNISKWPGRSSTDVNQEEPHGLQARGRTATFTSFLSHRTEERDRDPMPYLSYAATVGRNSLFIDLTEEQREELGGVEYRALKTLAWILCAFYFGFHVLGIICLVPWILNTSYKSVPEGDGQNPTWWGIFTPMSLFTDLGFTLTPDSMISFQYAVFPLLLGSFLIVIGNTGFPCMLRFTIWILRLLVPYGTRLYEELSFLLDHPRRCFTLLFPKQATWWLFAILVILNGIDIIFFIILDVSTPPRAAVSNRLTKSFS